jgi:hypothetical protein
MEKEENTKSTNEKDCDGNNFICLFEFCFFFREKTSVSNQTFKQFPLSFPPTAACLPKKKHYCFYCVSNHRNYAAVFPSAFCKYLLFLILPILCGFTAAVAIFLCFCCVSRSVERKREREGERARATRENSRVHKQR